MNLLKKSVVVKKTLNNFAWLQDASRNMIMDIFLK